MAFMDYGAIAFKNGKLISTDMFTPMIETCGFTDDGNPLPEMKDSFDGNYFVILGNKELLIGFYKTFMKMWSDMGEGSDEDSDEDYRYRNQCEMFGWEDFKGWHTYEHLIMSENYFITVKVKHRNGYYVATFKIDNDDYKVYFGYGVDLPFYKKTKRVNYYRSPEHFIHHLRYEIEHKIKMMKRKR